MSFIIFFVIFFFLYLFLLLNVILLFKFIIRFYFCSDFYLGILFDLMKLINLFLFKMMVLVLWVKDSFVGFVL